MIKNVFEEKTIRNANLPEAWQSQTALDELAESVTLIVEGLKDHASSDELDGQFVDVE